MSSIRKYGNHDCHSYSSTKSITSSVTQERIECCCQSQSVNGKKLKFTECTDQFLITESNGLTSCTGTTGKELEIIFEFSCTLIFLAFVHDVYSGCELQQCEIKFPTIKKCVSCNMQKLMKGCKAMEEELKDWPVGPEGRRQVVEFAWDRALEVIKSNLIPIDHKTFRLYFTTEVTHSHSYEKTISGDHYICREPVSGGCSICLEEYSEMSQVFRLPCSHVFHPDCINEWCTKSPTCPFCRFKIL